MEKPCNIFGFSLDYGDNVLETKETYEDCRRWSWRFFMKCFKTHKLSTMIVKIFHEMFQDAQIILFNESVK